MLWGLAAHIKPAETPPGGKETAGVEIARQAVQWLTRAC